MGELRDVQILMGEKSTGVLADGSTTCMRCTCDVMLASHNAVQLPCSSVVVCGATGVHHTIGLHDSGFSENEKKGKGNTDPFK